MSVIELGNRKLDEAKRGMKYGLPGFGRSNIEWWTGYIEGAEDQKREDEQPAYSWHRVEDGLPDKYTQCLVADADGKCAVGYYRYDCGAWDSPAFGWVEAEDRMYIDYMPMGIGKVVAWMPIEPPKEDA